MQGTNPLGSALTGWVLEQFGVSGGAAALGAATLAAVTALALAHRSDAMGAAPNADRGPAASRAQKGQFRKSWDALQQELAPVF